MMKILPILMLVLVTLCSSGQAFSPAAATKKPSTLKVPSTSNEREGPPVFPRQSNHPVSSQQSFPPDGALRASAEVTNEGDSLLPKKKRVAWREFAEKNFFLLGMFVAVGLARIAPSLGTNGGLLRPELVIGKYGVAAIFLLSGLSLELSQLTKAFSNVKLNTLVQLTTFAAWPWLIGIPLTRALGTFLPNVFPAALRDGLLILTCLPTTVNMNVILTGAAGGNVASALCHSVLSNLLGIFATPALLFRFFGSHITLPFVDMVQKLAYKVLLPVAVGQVLRATPVKAFYESNAKIFKRLSEVILLSILWNAFCTAISSSLGLDWKSGLGLLILLPLIHLLSWQALYVLFSQPVWNFSREDIVASLFCASQKTLAFGLPLVNTIFEGNPNLAAYCAPIMFIHPTQLILGSMLVPRLQKYTQQASGEKSE